MDVRASEWRVDASGARLAVRAWHALGVARGAVCIIHGLGEHSGRYVHVADAFTRHGWSVVAADLRGHGRSTGKRGHAGSIGQLVADVRVVVAGATTRIDPDRWVLYGHSMGGAVALSYALRFPDAISACLATAPAIRPAFATPAWKVALGRALRGVVPSLSLSNGIDANGLSHDPEVVRAYLADPLVHDRVSAALGVDLLGVGRRLLAKAAALRVPTLIVHGSDDPITSANASAEFARRAGTTCDHRVVPDAFHEVHNEVSWPATFSMMTQWLDSHC